ncbi:MAG: hypothetical protein AAGI15_12740 [Pseudomonadota bacterium]
MARTRTQHYRLLAICTIAVLLAVLANSAAGAPTAETLLRNASAAASGVTGTAATP